MIAGNMGTVSTGFASGTAMVETFEEATGVKITTTPGAKTKDRAVLLKNGTADVCWMTALDVLFALKGIEDFAEWGPQSYRSAWQGGEIPQGIAVQADSGIKTWADLKGRRVASYPTYAVVQLYTESGLAFGNLTWADVVETPVSSAQGGFRAVIEGAVDAAFFTGVSSASAELEASIHGIHWLPMPASDKAGWARVAQINPAFFPVASTIVPGSSADNPVDLWAYNYQITTYDTADPNLIYWFTKQIHVNYDAYKDKHAFLPKWTIEHALEWDAWFVPWHEGSIQYFKDIGLWTTQHDVKQKKLLGQWPQVYTQ